MKALFLLLTLTFLVAACHGPGGPATRTGRAIDRGANAVGQGVEKSGEVIQDLAR